MRNKIVAPGLSIYREAYESCDNKLNIGNSILTCHHHKAGLNNIVKITASVLSAGHVTRSNFISYLVS